MSRNGLNFIMGNEMTGEMFEKLCNVLIRRSKYRGEYKIIPLEVTMRPEPKLYQLTIYNIFDSNYTEANIINSTKTIFNAFGYPCEKYVTTNQTDTAFVIMAGPSETSVILIKPTLCNGEVCLIPADLVYDMTVRYLMELFFF